MAHLNKILSVGKWLKRQENRWDFSSVVGSKKRFSPHWKHWVKPLSGAGSSLCSDGPWMPLHVEEWDQTAHAKTDSIKAQYQHRSSLLIFPISDQKIASYETLRLKTLTLNWCYITDIKCKHMLVTSMSQKKRSAWWMPQGRKLFIIRLCPWWSHLCDSF